MQGTKSKKTFAMLALQIFLAGMTRSELLEDSFKAIV